MATIFVFLFVTFLSVNAFEQCQTPNGEAGECVLINHCPELFNALLNNKTTNTTNDQVRQSHCGFESMLFPKVCCPIHVIKTIEETHFSKYGTKCGLHTPDGPTDPWLALLEYEIPNRRRAFLCGGVVINKRYILTSAHCVRGPKIPFNAKIVNVILGNNSSSIPVDDTIVHENYDPTELNQYNDIALVRLKRKISFKEGNIRSICLCTKDVSKFIGKVLPSAGWELFNNVLTKRAGIATVWDNLECSQRYNATHVALDETQMCAGSRKQHSNHYGGVLMHLNDENIYSVVGIVSVEPSCCGKEQYKVYTRVFSYLDWIISNMKW